MLNGHTLSRRVVRIPLIAVPLLALAGCAGMVESLSFGTGAGPESPATMFNKDQVVVDSGWSVKPAEAATLAQAECALSDRDAYFQSQSQDAYWFTCRARKFTEPANVISRTVLPPPPRMLSPVKPKPKPMAKPAAGDADGKMKRNKSSPVKLNGKQQKIVALKSAPKRSYWVQVASRRKRADAESMARRIMQKNMDVMNSRSYMVHQAKVRNGNTYYRSRVGPYRTFTMANDVCGKLKGRKQDCIVIIR